jgi:hypothetical protein
MDLENQETIVVPNATVEFIKGNIGDVVTYKFSTVEGGHPMVNAMAGLAILEDGEQLIMLNHCAPMGLFPKIEAEFEFAHSELPSGHTQIVFSKKLGTTKTTDFSATSCESGCH